MPSIDSEQLRLLIERTERPAERIACIDELRKMIETQWAFLLHADASCGCCCGVNSGIAKELCSELGYLENALRLLEKGEVKEAKALLEKYRIKYLMGDK